MDAHLKCCPFCGGIMKQAYEVASCEPCGYELPMAKALMRPIEDEQEQRIKELEGENAQYKWEDARASIQPIFSNKNHDTLEVHNNWQTETHEHLRKTGEFRGDKRILEYICEAVKWYTKSIKALQEKE